MNLQQIHHFALVVTDLDKSVRWYDAILGFTVERRFGFPDAGVKIAHIINNGIRIELIEREGALAGPDAGRDAFGALQVQGAKHIGLQVTDLEATARELRNKNVEIVHDITTIEPAGVRNLWIRDNSGNLIEFNQWL